MITCVPVATALAIALVASAIPIYGQEFAFQRTLIVGVKEAPATLDVVALMGDVTINYRREGEVSIFASAKDESGKIMTGEFFKTGLLIEQQDNHVRIRSSLPGAFVEGFSISYLIEVPYRTEVSSSVETGNQLVMGITGPAKLTSGVGDIEVLSVRSGLVQATTGRGKIVCTRVGQVNAETGKGNITLMEDGPSKAVVKKGIGRIEVGGARGSVEASTEGGDLHIRADLLDDWQLSSISGSVRIELPKKSRFDFDASTSSGSIIIERGEMQKPPEDVRQFQQQVNGGGKRIQVRTTKGSISIQ